MVYVANITSVALTHLLVLGIRGGNLLSEKRLYLLRLAWLVYWYLHVCVIKLICSLLDVEGLIVTAIEFSITRDYGCIDYCYIVRTHVLGIFLSLISAIK